MKYKALILLALMAHSTGFADLASERQTILEEIARASHDLLAAHELCTKIILQVQNYNIQIDKLRTGDTTELDKKEAELKAAENALSTSRKQLSELLHQRAEAYSKLRADLKLAEQDKKTYVEKIDEQLQAALEALQKAREKQGQDRHHAALLQHALELWIVHGNPAGLQALHLTAEEALKEYDAMEPIIVADAAAVKAEIKLIESLREKRKHPQIPAELAAEIKSLRELIDTLDKQIPGVHLQVLADLRKVHALEREVAELRRKLHLLADLKVPSFCNSSSTH